MPVIIGISGCSGAGKTTLTEALGKKYKSTTFCWDDFDEVSQSPEDYLDWHNRGRDLAEFDYSALATVLGALKKGESIEHPVSGSIVTPTPLIFGCLPLGRTHHQTGKIADKIIHLSTPLDISLSRRLLQKLQEESSNQSELIEYLQTYLNDERALFIMEEVKNSADFVLDGSYELSDLLDSCDWYFKDASIL